MPFMKRRRGRFVLASATFASGQTARRQRAINSIRLLYRVRFQVAVAARGETHMLLGSTAGAEAQSVEYFFVNQKKYAHRVILLQISSVDHLIFEDGL